jgi:hypothetical protein
MKIEIEFYSDKTGCLQKGINLKWDNSEWLKFDDLDSIQIEIIFDRVAKDHKASKAFWHLAKNPNFNNKKEILQQFILCNWTKLDNRMDITAHKLQFENVSCPFKSNNKCQFGGKGIVCIKY